MAKKESLPAVVHDHFRKANQLHTYVIKHLGEATKHAIETGRELIAAKSQVPHGQWEAECERLFDGSLRTAQFYMSFAKDVAKLKSADTPALLMVEGGLEGAAKAARQAVRLEAPDKPKPESTPPPPPPPDDDSPSDEANCESEEESSGEPVRKGNGKPSTPPKQYDRSYWFKQWEHSIGPLVRLVDKIAHGVGEAKSQSHKTVQDHLGVATEEMMEWMGMKK